MTHTRSRIAAIGLTVVFGAGGIAFAQAAAMGQADKGMMKDGSMVVTGCIAAGKEEGQFVLDHATRGGGMMDKEKMAPGMGGAMMAFELVGGTNLKAHLGHKVEVTGTMSKEDMDMMHKMEGMSKAEKDKGAMSDKGMHTMKLNVTSVKMVSANCS